MTNNRKNLYSFFLLFFLTSCTSKIQVHEIAVSTPTGLKKVAGNYAAYIQTGGWAMKSKARSWVESTWTFEIDLNPSYKKAMQQLLESSLEKVTFFDRILTKEELNEKEFTAQISILQGSAEAGFTVHEGFFTSAIETTIDLNAIVSSFGPSGLQFQKEYKASGKGYNDNGEESSQIAAKNAIVQLTEIGALYIREGLRCVTEK